MNYVMKLLRKAFINFVFLCFLVLVFYYVTGKTKKKSLLLFGDQNFTRNMSDHIGNVDRSKIFIWCIITKVQDEQSKLILKFYYFIESLLRHSGSNRIYLNVLLDKHSKKILNHIIIPSALKMYPNLEVSYYDIKDASSKISNITRVMQPYFSSMPGTYYSDTLFYISLGLHQIAPSYQNKVILIDIDVQFRESVMKLYHQFFEFQSESLFGLAPELSPVYNHVLWQWKKKFPDSNFGEPVENGGFPGLNSGVVLLCLNKIRSSEMYRYYTAKEYIEFVTKKYHFTDALEPFGVLNRFFTQMIQYKRNSQAFETVSMMCFSHGCTDDRLGDQDFYTLLYMEHPELIHLLPCNWNKQLCKWWKYHGYGDIFDSFFNCSGPVYLYHGNCNSYIPKL